MRSFTIKVECRTEGAIGIFVWKYQTVEAANMREACSKARDHFGASGYETRGVECVDSL